MTRTAEAALEGQEGVIENEGADVQPAALQITAFTDEEVQVGEKTLPISHSYKQAVLARLCEQGAV